MGDGWILMLDLGIVGEHRLGGMIASLLHKERQLTINVPSNNATT